MPALHAAPSLLKRSQNGSIPLLTAIDTCLSRYTVNIDVIRPLFDDIENKILGNEDYSDDMRITKVFQRLEAFSSTDLSMKTTKPSGKVKNSTIEAILSMDEGDSSMNMENSSMEISDSSMNMTILAMKANNSSIEMNFNEDSANSSMTEKKSSTENQNPSMKFDFETDCGHIHITPEVQIKNFLEIGRFYQKISEIDQILDGNSTIFINNLLEAQKNVDERTKIVLQEIIDNLLMDFDKYYEPFHRLKLVVDEISRFSKDNPENLAFREVQVGQWGKLSDALNVYAMVRNFSRYI
uniref:HDAC_interact domain-containing protein n=1 Tax=Bursaphelenchus xylophilus TaxID=6326 RepID=A0A1I7SJ61_BURXY